nr:hypothetical protein FVER53263_20425 [Fusarium verticillioides]
MADGTVEYVGKNTVGDELGLMPNGYYFQSPQFIDPLTAQCLASTCAYLGWVLPSNTLNKFPRKIPKYMTPAITRYGLLTKSLPPLFKAINKGNYSDTPSLGEERKLRTLTLSDKNIRFGIFLPPKAGINKAIVDSVGDAVVKAYTSPLHYVFYATIPFSCIMLVAAFVGLDIKQFLTYNVAKCLQDKSFRKSSTSANEVEVQAMNECHPDEARVASYV